MSIKISHKSINEEETHVGEGMPQSLITYTRLVSYKLLCNWLVQFFTPSYAQVTFWTITCRK